MRRLARLAAVLALIGSAGLFGAGSASATALSIGQCTTSANVILAVDFSHWGGPLLRSCGSTPTTGYTLLNQGGWATQGTNHDGPAFICRIGYSGYQSGTKYPTPATEACNLTPPASAYWSYWHANPGQNTWSYSQLGAMSYKPVAGSVDLWIFGGTNIAGTEGTPQFSPDSVRAHNSAPTGGIVVSQPAVPPTSTPAGPGGDGGTAGAGTTSTAQASTPAAGRPSSSASTSTTSSPSPTCRTTTAPTHSASPSTPRSSSTAPASATPTCAAAHGSATPTGSKQDARSGATIASPGVAGQPRIIDAQPAADIKHSAGSYVPELVAGAILVVLGGFTGLRYWRRRQVSQPS